MWGISETPRGQEHRGLPRVPAEPERTGILDFDQTWSSVCMRMCLVPGIGFVCSPGECGEISSLI